MKDDLEKVYKELINVQFQVGQNGRMRLNKRFNAKVHPRTGHEDAEGE
jgi:hypothetical protein